MFLLSAFKDGKAIGGKVLLLLLNILNLDPSKMTDECIVFSRDEGHKGLISLVEFQFFHPLYMTCLNLVRV